MKIRLYLLVLLFVTIHGLHSSIPAKELDAQSSLDGCNQDGSYGEDSSGDGLVNVPEPPGVQPPPQPIVVPPPATAPEHPVAGPPRTHPTSQPSTQPNEANNDAHFVIFINERDNTDDDIFPLGGTSKVSIEVAGMPPGSLVHFVLTQRPDSGGKVKFLDAKGHGIAPNHVYTLCVGQTVTVDAEGIAPGTVTITASCASPTVARRADIPFHARRSGGLTLSGWRHH